MILIGFGRTVNQRLLRRRLCSLPLGCRVFRGIYTWQEEARHKLSCLPQRNQWSTALLSTTSMMITTITLCCTSRRLLSMKHVGHGKKFLVIVRCVGGWGWTPKCPCCALLEPYINSGSRVWLPNREMCTITLTVCICSGAVMFCLGVRCVALKVTPGLLSAGTHLSGGLLDTAEGQAPTLVEHLDSLDRQSCQAD